MKKQGTVILIGLLVLLSLSGCRRFVVYDPSQNRGSGIADTHTVRQGETLYSIAWQYGHDYRKMAKINNLKSPFTIYPGQKLNIVIDNSYSSQKKESINGPSQATRSYSKTTRKRRPSGASNRPIKWRWPTKGKIIEGFSAKDPGKKGLDIAGRKGQSIYAAADGKVVYSGNGLRGYGNLIIIKHNETYFSAYAHNSRLLVEENKKVKSGQHIADMGSSGADQIMLHFEIRRDGKPDDPLRFLPKLR